jgi:uncharacterized integral membrane protein
MLGRPSLRRVEDKEGHVADPSTRGGLGEPTAPPRDRRRDVRLVLTGILVALLLWFAFANLQTVSIDFWLWTTRAPLIVVIVISGFLGALGGSLASRRRSRSRHRDGSTP